MAGIDFWVWLPIWGLALLGEPVTWLVLAGLVGIVLIRVLLVPAWRSHFRDRRRAASWRSAGPGQVNTLARLEEKARRRRALERYRERVGRRTEK